MIRALPGLLLACLALAACEEAPDPAPARAGEIVRDAQVDWSFARDLPLAALLTTSPARSRAVWIVVQDCALYVPSGVAPEVGWPAQLEQDPVVLLRVQDRVYLRRATRVTDSGEPARVRRAVASKYGASDAPAVGGRWIFRMHPPDPATRG